MHDDKTMLAAYAFDRDGVLRKMHADKELWLSSQY